MRSLLCVLSVCLVLPLAATAQAGTLTVGPGQEFQTIDEAARAARDGDTVLITPGDYRECAVWTANDLTIMPIDWPDAGRVRVTDVTCQGKAIFVVVGANTTIEGLSFIGARVPADNGAGIRMEGKNLTLINVELIDNQNGMLSSPDPESTIIIRDSLVSENGLCEESCAHGIYINEAKELRIENSRFLNQREGHHIKSRAQKTVVLNSIIEDGDEGTASYLIEATIGGDLIVKDSVLQKGPNSENSNAAIAIAAEGAKNPGTEIIVSGNTFRNDLGRETNFVWNLTRIPVQATDNELVGPVREVKGTRK